MAAMDNTTDTCKLVCPHCEGHAELEMADYTALAGTEIDCPHCSHPYPIPPLDMPAHTPEPEVMIPAPLPAPQPLRLRGRDGVPAAPAPGPATQLRMKASPAGASRCCPKCADPVGPRDRVCIVCGSPIPL